MKDLDYLLHPVKAEYNSAEKYKFNAQFYPYKNVSHTIRIKNETIFLRISDKLKNAPDEILKSITNILFNKLFRIKTPTSVRKTYRDYLGHHIIPYVKNSKTKVSSRYKALGTYYDLDSVFDKVNNKYFFSNIKKPIIGWSFNESTRRLGFYDHERNLLVVSKIFDHRKVPAYVVEYIMYHEILHIVHPAKRSNGRRVVHPREFKNQEILFKEYKQATNWLNKKLWRLKFLF